MFHLKNSSSSSSTSSYLFPPLSTRSSSPNGASQASSISNLSLETSPATTSVTLVDTASVAQEDVSWMKRFRVRVAKAVVSIKHITKKKGANRIERTSRARPTISNPMSLSHNTELKSGVSMNPFRSSQQPNCKPISVKKVHSYKPNAPTVVLAPIESRPASNDLFGGGARSNDALFVSIPQQPSSPACTLGSRQIERQSTSLLSGCHLLEDNWVTVSKENTHFDEKVQLKGQQSQVPQTSSHEPRVPTVHRIKRKPVDCSLLLDCGEANLTQLKSCSPCPRSSNEATRRIKRKPVDYSLLI